jgi:hypothetical protein
VVGRCSGLVLVALCLRLDSLLFRVFLEVLDPRLEGVGAGPSWTCDPDGGDGLRSERSWLVSVRDWRGAPVPGAHAALLEAH